MTLGSGARRPMPRQLDMSGWGEDSSSSSVAGTQRNGGICSASREDDDFDYGRKEREPLSRYDTMGQSEYRNRQLPRDAGHVLNSGGGSHVSEYSVNSSASDRRTTHDSMFDSAATTISSNMGGRRNNRLSSTYTSDSHESGRHHDNQRETDEFSGGTREGLATWDRTDTWASGRPTKTDLREDDSYSASMGSLRYSSSRGSFEYGRTEKHFDLLKADSIREAESAKLNSGTSFRTSSDEDNGFSRRASEVTFSSVDNQNAPNSPTISDVSSPSSPDLSSDYSTAHFPKPFPCSSDRTSVSQVRVSSPSSSVSTVSKAFTTTQKTSQSSMSDLREELYAFRRQMREVFIRVEDMVDIHRSFFKSDPSTGSPVFNSELQKESEQQANDTFEQLADLRLKFSRLAKDFQRSEEVSNERGKTRRAKMKVSVPSRAQAAESDDEGISLKVSDIHDGECNNPVSERLAEAIKGGCLSSISAVSPVGSAREFRLSTRESSEPPQADSDDEDTHGSVMSDSARSTTSNRFSSQLTSRWRESRTDSGTPGIGRRSLSSAIDTSSPKQRSIPSKTSEPDTSNIFKDFDQRMEEIRSSLNAIASGKPHPSTPPKIFKRRGGANSEGSPIHAMMDVSRTRATLLEASRISSGIKDDQDDKPKARGNREAELGQLLQELNHINSSSSDTE